MADRPAQSAAEGALEGPDQPRHWPFGRPVTAPTRVGNYAVLIMKIVGNYAVADTTGWSSSLQLYGGCVGGASRTMW